LARVWREPLREALEFKDMSGTRNWNHLGYHSGQCRDVTGQNMDRFCQLIDAL